MLALVELLLPALAISLPGRPTTLSAELTARHGSLGTKPAVGIGVPAFGLFCHCPQDGLMSGIFLLRQRWQGDQKSVATTSAALKAKRNFPPVLPERNLATLGSRMSRS